MRVKYRTPTADADLFHARMLLLMLIEPVAAIFHRMRPDRQSVDGCELPFYVNRSHAEIVRRSLACTAAEIRMGVH